MVGQISKLIRQPGFTGKQPGEVRTQFGHRMGSGSLSHPSLAAEIQYDHYSGSRFRHGEKFLRWRPDKKAESCTAGQVRQ
jgi:ATP-dependent DNA ligase